MRGKKWKFVAFVDRQQHPLLPFRLKSRKRGKSSYSSIQDLLKHRCSVQFHLHPCLTLDFIFMWHHEGIRKIYEIFKCEMEHFPFFSALTLLSHVPKRVSIPFECDFSMLFCTGLLAHWFYCRIHDWSCRPSHTLSGFCLNNSSSAYKLHRHCCIRSALAFHIRKWFKNFFFFSTLKRTFSFLCFCFHCLFAFAAINLLRERVRFLLL